MSIPAPFRRLVDDAAVFPPGLTPLPEAVPGHATHLRSALAELVGPFVVGADDLDAVAGLAEPRDHPGGLQVSVVVSSPAAVPGVVSHLAGSERLVLAGLEVKLEPARSAAEQVHELAAQAQPVTTYVEVPRPADPAWPDVLAAVARHGFRLKFRTGGVEAVAFPSEVEVADWIADATGAGVPFKCTAGLHRAVRHTGEATGFEHHGYLSLLLAAARALAGADREELRATLAERDDTAVAVGLTRVGADGLASARAAFTSYGSCSVTEPYDDLQRLQLLSTTSEES